jgi:hypothetical protein
MELLRRKCPGCHSADIQHHSPYSTKNHGARVIYKCEHCPVYCSETKHTRTSDSFLKMDIRSAHAESRSRRHVFETNAN